MALGSTTRQPRLEDVSDELRAVIAPKILWNSVFLHQPVENLEDTSRYKRGSNLYRKALASEVVAKGQHLEFVPVRERVKDKVHGPDLPRTHRTQQRCFPRIRRLALLALARFDLKTLLFPEPMHSVLAGFHSLSAEEVPGFDAPTPSFLLRKGV
jgi:hypothetical protein